MGEAKQKQSAIPQFHERISTQTSKMHIPTPNNSEAFSIKTLNEGTLLHRVHLRKYGAIKLNPGTMGNARFSPITDRNGAPIPTIYAGSTTDCALMETVFHDVPHTQGLKVLDKQKLSNQVHSQIELTQSLSLIDLCSIALRRIGLTRGQLVDTEKDAYPATRSWAARVHALCKHAQGLFWVSRQDDAGRAVMLFGDRLSKNSIRQVGHSYSLLDDDSSYEMVLDLAERIGVNIVPGTQVRANP